MKDLIIHLDINYQNYDYETNNGKYILSNSITTDKKKIETLKKMKHADLVYTKRFLNSFGNKIVLAIRKVTPVDTGELKKSIDFNTKVVLSKNEISVSITHNGAEYGMYLDDIDNTGNYHYRKGRFKGQRTTGFISDTILGMEDEFLEGLEKAYSRDLERFITKQIKK